MIHEFVGHTDRWSKHRLVTEDGTTLVELFVEPMALHLWEPPIGYEIPEGAQWTCELVDLPPPLPNRWLRFTDAELHELARKMNAEWPLAHDIDVSCEISAEISAEITRREDDD